MPNDPEHRLNKPLRDLADKRRHWMRTEFTLDPVGRRMLQDEVRMQFRKADSSSRSWFMPVFSSRLGWAVAIGVVALAGMTIWQMNTGQPQPTEIAQGPSQPVKKQKETGARSYSPAPKAVSSDAEAERTTAKVPEALAASEGSRDTSRVEMTFSAAPMQTLSLADEAPMSLGRGVRMQQALATETRRRVLNDGVERFSPVLSTQFELQQNANVVKIIDGDGSVYAGNTVFSDEAAPEQDALAAPFKPLGAATNSLRFIVMGTNLTTGQRIEFSGHLQTNQSIVASTQVLPKEAEALASQKNSDVAEMATVTLQGSLRVGTNLPMSIRADQIGP